MRKNGAPREFGDDDSLEPPCKKQRVTAHPQGDYPAASRPGNDEESAGDDDGLEPPCKKPRSPACPQGEHPVGAACNLNEIRTAWDKICNDPRQLIGPQDCGGRDPNIFTCKIRKRHHVCPFSLLPFLR